MEAATTRSPLHAIWDAVAPAWGDNADYVDARSARATERILELTAPQPGQLVIELACGAGGLGLAAAAAVGEAGRVVLSDVAPEMVAIAARRAASRGLGNVSTRVLDIEQIEEADASYDVVLCREGLMFASDHAAAAREIVRVLRPGGRFAVAVWGPREANPWLGLVIDAVGAELGIDVPPPGVPGPFSLSDRERLSELFRDAGGTDVVVAEQPLPLTVTSFDEWWSRTSALAGPLQRLLASLDESALAAIRERAREASRVYANGDGLDFPGMTLLAYGSR